MELSDLVIHEKFVKALRPLDAETLKRLTADIVAEGFDENLYYWSNAPDGQPYLVEGHHRYQISMNCPDLDGATPTLKGKKFDSEEAVIRWIKKRHANRRNLNKSELKSAIAEAYQQRRRKHGGSRQNGKKPPENGGSDQVANSATCSRTRDEIAEEFSVSPRTVHNAVARQNALETIRGVDAKFAAEIASEERKISDADIIAMGKLDGRGIKASIRKLDETVDTASEASIVKDAIDRDVPSHLLQKHDAAAAINSAANKLDPLRRSIEELAGEPGGAFLPVSEIKELFKKLKGLVSQSRYWSECPRCCGKVKSACKRCDGNGFIPFSRRGMLSSEEKEWLGVG